MLALPFLEFCSNIFPHKETGGNVEDEFCIVPYSIKSELYLAKWKWILRSGPKLKMLVKFHRSNGSFPNPLKRWRIRFGCTALDQCYWNKENWFCYDSSSRILSNVLPQKECWKWMLGWLFFVFLNSGGYVCSHKEIGGRDEEECSLYLPEFCHNVFSFFTKRLVAGLKSLCLL